MSFILEKQESIIITGEKNSGKSSACFDITKAAADLWGGIVSKAVMKGNEKTGYECIHVSTGESIISLSLNPRELMDGAVRKAGIKYWYSPEAFSWAIKRILMDLDSGRKHICIDEIGPLELHNLGFYDIIRPGSRKPDVSYLLVIRNGILDKAREKFALKDMRVISL